MQAIDDQKVAFELGDRSALWTAADAITAWLERQVPDLDPPPGMPLSAGSNQSGTAAGMGFHHFPARVSA